MDEKHMEQPVPSPEKEEEQERERPGPSNPKERLYDKMSVTYRQVDIFVKVLLAAIVVVLIVGIVQGAR